MASFPSQWKKNNENNTLIYAFKDWEEVDVYKKTETKVQKVNTHQMNVYYINQYDYE